MKLKNKVMLYAYTRYNLGDDLLIKIICDRYKEVGFVIYTYPQYREVLSECKNLEVYPNLSIISKLTNKLGNILQIKNAYERSVAQKCDLCVCITGSLFIQGSDNWKPYLEYMQSRKINGKPYFQLGSNFGPYNDPMFLKGFKELFSSYTDVCFREEYSYALFSDLANVRVAPDVVLSGDYKKYIDIDSEKRVACSVIDLSNRPELYKYKESYLRFLEDICIRYLKQGYIVDLLSFCRCEGDENTVEELERRINNNKLIHHLYVTDTDLDGMLICIGKAEIVIASRFHAMILGWSMGKKTLPIIYSSKMRNVINDFGFDGLCYDIAEHTHFDVAQMLPSSFDVGSFCKKANNQFEKLDLYLKHEI